MGKTELLVAVSEIKPYRLDGKFLAITGGNRGIGKATALRFGQEGSSVVLLLQRTPADDVIAELSDLGTRGVWIECDVSDEQSRRQAVKGIEAEVNALGKGLDGFVNNAGITEDAIGASRMLSMETISVEDTERMLDVNLTGAMGLTTRLLREDLFDHSDGKIPSIVNMASIRGCFWTMMGASYDISKAGLITWTKGLTATVLHDFEYLIRANAICPGFIETDETKDLPPLLKEIIRFLTPLKRFGRPEEVAGIVAHYMSDDTKFVTGSEYAIDGGLSNIVSAAVMIYEGKSEIYDILRKARTI